MFEALEVVVFSQIAKEGEIFKSNCLGKQRGGSKITYRDQRVYVTV